MAARPATSSGIGVLGRYTILRHLAQGGMAEVLLARASGIEGFERHVVIKRIRAEQARDERFVGMFLDEARLAAALHHHNIVQVHDIGEEQGEYFFAMEYVHGEDLRKVLLAANRSKQPVPFEHVVTIITGAAAGLHYAHEQRGLDRKPLGIVHRDVTPANILIGYDGAVKVADFGIAKAAFRTAETQSGILKGKVAYMSPEQCTGRPVDRRSDVFALGIVLYELATVRRLFKGDSDYDIMAAIVHGDIPPPSTKRPDLPAELEKIILKALSLAPGDRYASTHEMRLAVEAYANTAGLRTSTSTLADYMIKTFGERPEPWLVEADPLIQPSVDFDGSGSGIVGVPSPDQLPEVEDAGPNSPIAKARRRATGAPPVGAVASEPTSTPSSFQGTSPTGSGEPLAWAAEDDHVESPRPSRTWIAITAGVAAVLGLVIFVARSSTHESEPARQPSAPIAPATPPVEPPPPPVVVAPRMVAPAPVTPAVVAPPPADQPKLADEPKKPPPPIAAKPKPPPKPKDPKDQWDPNSLFPK